MKGLKAWARGELKGLGLPWARMKQLYETEPGPGGFVKGLRGSARRGRVMQGGGVEVDDLTTIK